MSDIKQARKALVKRVLEGPGNASTSVRRAAFDLNPPTGPVGTVVHKVARHAFKITDEDIVAVKADGFSDDQIFEIVVCAAIGQASRQYDAALAALDAATGKE